MQLGMLWLVRDKLLGVPAFVKLVNWLLLSLVGLASLYMDWGYLQWQRRADSRFAPSQWETPLLCNDVSHWLVASLESALQGFLAKVQCAIDSCDQWDFLPYFKSHWHPCTAVQGDCERVNIYLEQEVWKSETSNHKLKCGVTVTQQIINWRAGSLWPWKLKFINTKCNLFFAMGLIIQSVWSSTQSMAGTLSFSVQNFKIRARARHLEAGVLDACGTHCKHAY